jgi:hypothetical protein
MEVIGHHRLEAVVTMEAVVEPERASLKTRYAERLLAVAAALGIAAALAGCSATSAKHPPKAASSTPRATASRPSPGPPHAMGDKVVLGGTVQAVVFQYRQPAAPDPAAAGPSGSPAVGHPGAPAPSVAPGRTYGAADVQVCVNSKATTTVAVSWKTWALVYGDFTVVPASTTDSEQFTQPAFPFAERVVPAGRCVRGWITFPVPADQRPSMVEYQPHGYLADWTVPSS